MDKLKAILKERKISIKDEELSRRVQEFGYDPSSLSDENAQLVAEELSKPPAAIATRPKGNGNGKAQSNGDTESFKKALLHAFGEKQKELKAFEGQLGKHRQQWMEEWVSQNLNIIHNTSTDAFEMLKTQLLQEEANAESFLRAADELASELFAAQ